MKASFPVYRMVHKYGSLYVFDRNRGIDWLFVVSRTIVVLLKSPYGTCKFSVLLLPYAVAVGSCALLQPVGDRQDGNL
jgi:hypothetical protein